MIPLLYQVEIELKEATFFASHELDAYYFTEPIIGNYALAYALGLVKSPYNRTEVGYAEDLPFLNQEGIYITPARALSEPRYRIEKFNCQSESYPSAMLQNAVVELAGRQYQRDKFIYGQSGAKRIRPTNRPQIGTLKLLSPENRFVAHLLAKEALFLPDYVRLGKFMSKAKICHKPVKLSKTVKTRAVYPLINPLDLGPEQRIWFGDTINIHPVPLIRNAEIEGSWFTDENETPILPANLMFRGI